MVTPEPIPARPWALIVRVTDACRVGCDHCCVSAVPKGVELDARLLAVALREAGDAGVGLIHFSGGEPLLRYELEGFVARATELGFFVEVTTSTFTTPDEPTADRVAALRDAGLKRVMLSYDAAHARRVPIDQYAGFMREAQDCGLRCAPWSWTGRGRRGRSSGCARSARPAAFAASWWTGAGRGCPRSAAPRPARSVGRGRARRPCAPTS